MLCVIFLLVICDQVASKSPASSRFEREFKDISDNPRDFTRVRLATVNCSRTCHTDDSCLRLIYNENSEECQLFETSVIDRDTITLADGDLMFQKIIEDGVCGMPTAIPNGTVLYIDGLAAGSRATFSCAGYHIPTISSGVCSPGGVWTGLDNPCQYGKELPIEIQVSDQIVPGDCFIIMWTFEAITWGSVKLINDDMNTQVLSIYFDWVSEQMLLNTYINNTWGVTEGDIPYWPLTLNQSCNFTLCTDVSFYQITIDGVEFITYHHRLPPADVKILKIDGDYVDLKSVQFIG